MSYLVLARKYRPKTFAEMVGQEHVVQALTNALVTGRLHHAWMFTGTRGVGKTTVSRILAKSLNCTGPDGQGGVTAEPCGVCQSCIEIDAGRFVDYTELDAASNRGVDEVQGLLEQAVYKPVQGRFKVFMIDEVHMLTGHAFNAMLKTLEEPPEYLKFVLATTDPQKVPVTVLSRCLQFNLRPMVPETVFHHLQHVLQAENLTAEPAALQLLARAARGSMRDALSLTDQAIAYCAGQGGESGLQVVPVRQMLGSVDSSYVLRLLESLAQGNPADMLGIVQELRRHGLSAAHTLEEMTRVLQRMAVFQAVPAGFSDSPDPDDQEISRIAHAMPADETQLLYSLCLHGKQELGLAPDEYAALSMVLLRLLAFKQPQQPCTENVATQTTPAEKKSLNEPGDQPAVPRQREVTAAPAETQQAAIARQVPTAPLPVAANKPEEPAVPVGAPPTMVATGMPPWEDAAEAVPLQQPACEPVAAPEPADTVAVLTLPVVELPAPLRDRPVPEEGQRASPAPRGVARRLVPTELGEVWYTLADSVLQGGKLAGFARELLLQSQLMLQEQHPHQADRTRWTVRVENETLNHEPSRRRLEQALLEMGHAVVLQVELGRVVDSPALRMAQTRAEQQQRAEQAFSAHPFVQAMMRDFGVQPAPGSVGFVAPDSTP